ncbi:MAG: hypothetical protein KDA36_10960, partial [Planctomycetaceae bacterium]|nr:hypothetical protein [Planctomycetaceae bacterium]
GLLDVHRDRRKEVGKPFRRLFTAGLLVVTVLGATTRVVVVAEEPKPSESKVESSKLHNEGNATRIEWTGIPLVDQENATVHRGVVLGPEGKPISGASIYAASTIELLDRTDEEQIGPRDLGEVRAVTDDLGRFQFMAEDLSWMTSAGVRKRWETLLVATKEGFAPGWIREWGEDRSFYSHWHPHPKTEMAIRMRPPAKLTGTFSLQEGGPLSGASVRLTGVMAPVKYDLDQHIPREEENPPRLFSPINYADQLYRPTLLPGLTTIVTTNDEGSFEIPGLPEGFIVEVEVTHPEAVTTRMRAAVRHIETVFRAPYNKNEKPTISLYGSGFRTELAKGTVLRGEVFSSLNVTAPRKKAVGVVVAQANHNARHGISGPRFTTDAEGRFEVTGLMNRPEGYELAFIGTFEAPYAGRRQLFFPGAEGRLQLQPAVRYRLKLTDPEGNPIDREVSSIEVQQTPGQVRKDVKSEFNIAERVGPGLYQGILPEGPAAVLVKRGTKRDRPVAVQPKEVFAGTRSDWTLEEERYAYGDAWGIATPAVSRTDNL